MVATDRLLYLDGERTDELVFAEVYGTTLREYAIVKDAREIEDIVNGVRDFASKGSSTATPLFTRLSILRHYGQVCH